MATTHGSEGVVKIGSNTIAEVVDFSVTETAAYANATRLSDTNVVTNATAHDRQATGSVTCHWDETDVNGQEAMVAGATVALELYPGGESSSGLTIANARITEVGVANQRGEVVSRTFSFESSGSVAWS